MTTDPKPGRRAGPLMTRPTELVGIRGGAGARPVTRNCPQGGGPNVGYGHRTPSVLCGKTFAYEVIVILAKNILSPYLNVTRRTVPGGTVKYMYRKQKPRFYQSGSL